MAFSSKKPKSQKKASKSGLPAATTFPFPQAAGIAQPGKKKMPTKVGGNKKNTKQGASMRGGGSRGGRAGY